MIRHVVILITYIVLSFVLSSCTHKTVSVQNMHHFEKMAASDIGISITHIETGKTFNYKERERFQMASTVKVPIGIYLLHLVEHKKIDLDKMVRVEPGDLVLGSGLMGYYLSKPGLAISLYNMFEPMLAISDNSATDIILREIGGPQAVYSFLQKHNLGDIMVNRSIEQIYASSAGIKLWPDRRDLTLTKRLALIQAIPDDEKQRAYKTFYNDPLDTTTPAAMSMLMAKLYNGELLNAEHTKIILDVMSKDKFSRIKNILPKNMKLLSKTGTWWDNKSKGIHYNYMSETGIITLPDNEGHIAFAIYTKSDHSTVEKQKKAIESVMKRVIPNFAQVQG